MESIKYGIRKPSSDFEKRTNERNAPGKVTMVKGKCSCQKSAPAKQSKGIGKA